MHYWMYTADKKFGVRIFIFLFLIKELYSAMMHYIEQRWQ